jgi:hypothetical protein
MLTCNFMAAARFEGGCSTIPEGTAGPKEGFQLELPQPCVLAAHQRAFHSARGCSLGPQSPWSAARGRSTISSDQCRIYIYIAIYLEIAEGDV